MTIPMIPMAVLGAEEEGAVADEGGASSRQGIDLVNMVGQGYTTTHYPGDNEQFYIQVTVTYAGAAYPPPPAPAMAPHVIFRTKVTVDAITDANFNVVTNSPITWVTNTLDELDGMNEPLNLTQGGSYNLFPDNEHTATSRLEFNVKSTAVPLGTYNIRFRVAADLITDYTAGPPAAYTYTNHWEYAYLQLDVLTPLTFVSSNSYTEVGTGVEPMYAGAVHEKYGVSVNQAGGTGTINAMNAKLEIADTHFKIVEPVAVSNAFVANPEFLWMIDVAKGTPPALYRATVTYTYDREITPGAGFVHITEAAPSLVLMLRVEWTPLLNFPDAVGYTHPLVTLTQNTYEADFTVPVSNTGNVKLENIRLRLDLSAAQYFKNGEFYYDENNNAAITWKDISFDLGNLSIGESRDAVFSDAMLKANLPPGFYKIPLDYIANYADNGTFGSSDYKRTGYDDDWTGSGLTEYQSIHVASDYPQPATPFYPFIYIEIVDDAKGVEVDGNFANNPYNPAWSGQFRLDVTNREKYAFSDLTYKIPTGLNSPFKIMGVPDTDTTEIPVIRDTTLAASGTRNLYFYAALKQTIAPGAHNIVVETTAFDPHNKMVTFNFNAVLIINPQEPSFSYMSYTSELLTDNTAQVTVNFKNTGWGGAYNASMFFRSNNANIIVVGDPVPIGDVMPGDIVNYTFVVKTTSPTYALAGSWNGYIYWEYTNEAGSVKPLFSMSSYTLYFVVQPKMPYVEITNVEAPGLNPGDTVQVTLNLVNVGGSTAFDVNVMWNSDNSIFAVQGQSSFSLGDMIPGQNASVTFTVKVSTAIWPAESYYVEIYRSFVRVDGYGGTFYEGGTSYFYLNTNAEVIPTKSEQVVESRQSGYTWDLGYMFLGLFIFLAIVIGVMIYKKPTHPTAHVRYDDMDRTEPASRHAEDDWRRPGSGGSGGAPPSSGTAQKK